MKNFGFRLKPVFEGLTERLPVLFKNLVGTTRYLFGEFIEAFPEGSRFNDLHLCGF